jgi:hypothetical protein
LSPERSDKRKRKRLDKLKMKEEDWQNEDK